MQVCRFPLPCPGPSARRSVSVSMCPPPGAALLPSQPPSAHLSCSWPWHFHPPPPSRWSQGSESHSRRLSLPGPLRLPSNLTSSKCLQWRPFSIPHFSETLFISHFSLDCIIFISISLHLLSLSSSSLNIVLSPVV